MGWRPDPVSLFSLSQPLLFSSPNFPLSLFLSFPSILSSIVYFFFPSFSSVGYLTFLLHSLLLVLSQVQEQRLRDVPFPFGSHSLLSLSLSLLQMIDYLSQESSLSPFSLLSLSLSLSVTSFRLGTGCDSLKMVDPS